MRCPQPEKAVAIARDALEQLDQHTYCKGIYLRVRLGIEGMGGDLAEALPSMKGQCRVCLLGSLLVSKARLYDQVPLASLSFDDVSPKKNLLLNVENKEVFSHLEAIFGRHQLVLLESFFEGVVFVSLHDQPLYDLAFRCAMAGNRIISFAERVRTALENFIANNGELVLAPDWRG